MQYRPADRPRVSDLLNHPWFQTPQSLCEIEGGWNRRSPEVEDTPDTLIDDIATPKAEQNSERQFNSILLFS